MRFVAAGENAKWTRAFSAFTHDSVNRTHVRIVPVTAVLEIEKRTGANVGFSRKRDAISQRFQVVGNVSNMVKRLSVIWMGTRFHGVLTGVDVVSSGRTHRGTLEAVSHSHPLGCQTINIRGIGLSSVTANVTKRTVVGDNEKQIGLGFRRSCFRAQ